MGSYAYIGLAVGFVVGLLANAYLLQGVPREKYLNNKSMRRRFGLLNWGIALLGMIIGIVLQRAH